MSYYYSIMSSNNSACVKEFHLEADNKAALEKLVFETINAEDKNFLSYGVAEPEKKRVVEYCVLIKGEKRAKGNSIDEALSIAESSQPEMIIKATIRYNLSKEELDCYERRKKPSSAEPLESFRFTNNRF